MEFDSTASLSALAALPPEPPKPPRRVGVWGAAMRGIGAAVGEVAADVAALGALRPQPDAPERRATRMGPQIQPDSRERQQVRQDIAPQARDAARSLRPDPITASTAESLVFDLSRGLTKGIGAVLAAGPVGGAAVFGGSEGAAAFDDLTRKGVDSGTALKAAGVTATAGAASVALPLAGQSLKATAALYAAGGPGAFMAQQAATSAILSRAGYGKIAEQYDPLDPLGLTLSALIPLPFAGYGAWRNVKASKAAKGSKAAPPPAAPEPEAAPEVVDAAMVHNLTVQRDLALQPMAQTASEGVPRATPLGQAVIVTTERGMDTPVRYRVVSADELVTSNRNDLTVNPDYPAELQPRERTRAASQEQIARIEGNIRPELLGESVKASDGAPIIGRDGVVESGNARTIALRRAYESDRAEGYRAWLEQNAGRFGIDPEQVRQMQRPVLVRERVGEIDRAEFARQANEASIAAMSPTEQAKADAARIKDLSGLVANDDGSINLAKSGDFIRQFVRDVVAPTERGTMLQADGRLSAAGQQRMRNAVFAKAYGDADLVSMLTEATDSNVRNVLAGMMRAAPDVARLQDLIGAGARQPIDVSADLVRAARELSRLRAEGTPVEAFLAQGNLMGDGLPPQVKELLQALAENARSPRRTGELVRQLVQAVDSLGDPRQADMLGGGPARAEDVTREAASRTRAIADADILDGETAMPKASADALVQSVVARAEAVQAENADMPVRLTEDGQQVTVADELAAARREAIEGTADDMGAADADLLRVAAECALSVGQ